MAPARAAEDVNDVPGFVERRTGTEWRGQIEADDVFQNVYIAVHEGIKDFV